MQSLWDLWFPAKFWLQDGSARWYHHWSPRLYRVSRLEDKLDIIYHVGKGQRNKWDWKKWETNRTNRGLSPTPPFTQLLLVPAAISLFPANWIRLYCVHVLYELLAQSTVSKKNDKEFRGIFFTKASVVTSSFFWYNLYSLWLTEFEKNKLPLPLPLLLLLVLVLVMVILLLLLSLLRLGSARILTVLRTVQEI